jgi:hypothetical protein
MINLVSFKDVMEKAYELASIRLMSNSSHRKATATSYSEARAVEVIGVMRLFEFEYFMELEKPLEKYYKLEELLDLIAKAETKLLPQEVRPFQAQIRVLRTNKHLQSLKFI